MTATAPVTGASGGIGHELARLLAADGYDLVLVARSEDRLVEVGETLTDEYGVRVTVVAKNLTDPAAPGELKAALDERGVVPTVLVNSAGFATYGPFLETDLEAELSEALSEELRGTGMTVTALCPGPTDMEFQDRADMHASRLLDASVRDPAWVAARGYRAMHRGDAVVVPGFREKLGSLVARLLPRSVVRRIVRRAQASG